MVTMPLGVTRAVIDSVRFQCWHCDLQFVTGATNCAGNRPCNVGTVVPTLTVAGMLSVAMTEGAEMILALLSDSISVTRPSSSRLFPTNMAAERRNAMLARLPSNEAAVDGGAAGS